MKRHPFDAISCVFGVIFLVAAALVALPPNPLTLLFDRLAWDWVVPTAVIAIGIALLIPALRASRTDRARDGDATTGEETVAAAHGESTERPPL